MKNVNVAAGAGSFAAQETAPSEQIVERVARTLVASKGAILSAGDLHWPATLAHYRAMVAEYGEAYSSGRSLVSDAFRDARVAIKAVDDARAAIVASGENAGITQHREAVEPLSSHGGTMREALEPVRGIIVDAAMTGFNHADGDWAERLFASQATTKAALSSTGEERREAREEWTGACRYCPANFRTRAELEEHEREHEEAILTPRLREGLEKIIDHTGMVGSERVDVLQIALTEINVCARSLLHAAPDAGAPRIKGKQTEASEFVAAAAPDARVEALSAPPRDGEGE